jgi:hypothetical protein
MGMVRARLDAIAAWTSLVVPVARGVEEWRISTKGFHRVNDKYSSRVRVHRLYWVHVSKCLLHSDTLTCAVLVYYYGCMVSFRTRVPRAVERRLRRVINYESV